MPNDRHFKLDSYSRRVKSPAARIYLWTACASLLAVAGAAALTKTTSSGGGNTALSSVKVVSGGAPANATPLRTAVAADDASGAATTGNVSVSGNQLLRDGVQWTPHGVQLIGLVQSPKIQQYYIDNIGKIDGDSQEQYDSKWTWFKQAYDHFNHSELDAIKTWGANTIRLQVSKVAVDPQSGDYYDPDFVAKIVDGVRYARQIGLNVIVAIQWENQNRNAAPGNGVSDNELVRDWQNLAPYFANDKGIILEMINEPFIKTDSNPGNWQTWATAMNNVATTIRNAGANNVLLADGSQEATTLRGFPRLADPQLFYAVHAYFLPGNDTPAEWDANFGNAAASVPVINGEWTTLTNGGAYECNTNTPQLALDLLSYQRQRHIGLVAVAYDTPRHWGGISADFNGTATTFVGTDCQDAQGRFGPGRMVQYWYRNNNLPGSPN